VLAQKVELAPRLQMDGLFCYPGHIWDLPDEQGAVMAKVSSMLAEALAMFKQHGLAAPIVSGGSTPTAYQSHLVSEYTEIRPGTYLFNDMNTVRGGFCSLDDCAATIVATVVSNAVSGQVVIDAGSKTLTSDICIPAPDSGYGYMVEYPLARISILSEEHGQVDVRSCDRPPAIGERVTIIPNHICPCVNLQNQAWWNEPSQSFEPIRIDARGKVS
jgi:D-serine deaminase-like pyridoxal phosphate-dependent protein